MTLTIAALASGRGSNIAAIVKAIDDGLLDASVALILTNNPNAGVLDFAKERGIDTWAKSHKGLGRDAFDEMLIDAITAVKADVVVLAGYMRLVSARFVSAFSGRIVNIHPAVLPSFPGAHGGADAIAYGVRLAGVTVHFVDEIMDNGPIIVQGVVPVSPADTEAMLMQRIQRLEHRLYPQALQWLAEDRLVVEGRNVHVKPAKFPCAAVQVKERNACSADKILQTPLGSYGISVTGQGEEFPWLISPALEGF